MSAHEVKRPDDYSVFVDVARKSISRAGKPEVCESAVTQQESGGMRIEFEFVGQTAHDSSLIIKSSRRGDGVGRRRYDQILKSTFSGGASVLSDEGNLQA